MADAFGEFYTQVSLSFDYYVFSCPIGIVSMHLF
jgi:hypothetical protein